MGISLLFFFPMLGSYYVELQIAILIFFSTVKKKRRFGLRLAAYLLFTALCAFLAIITSTLVLEAAVDDVIPNNSRPYMAAAFILGRLIIFLSCCAAITFVYSDKLKNMIYLAVGAHAMQSLVYSVNMFVSFFMPNEISMWINTFAGDLIAYTVCAFLLTRYIERVVESDELYVYHIILLLSVIIAMTLVTSGIGTVYRYESPVLFVVLNLYQFLCSFVILYIELFMSKFIAYKQETSLLLYMREQERKQYNITKESMNIIDLKCHDLRHQILAFSQNGSIPDEYIGKLLDSVSTYGSSINTGNKDLDVVLTGKSMECASKKIDFSIIADGSALDFMSTSDIYSLFGNALENAIEYVQTLAEDKKYIKVKIEKANHFSVIQIRNHYEGEALDIKDGILASSKGDAVWHGFGTRSMKRIAEEYGGVMNIKAKDHVFCLSFLFPIKAG